MTLNRHSEEIRPGDLLPAAGAPSATFRERRREAVVAAFVDAAEKTIAEKGFERATMQDVARAAGCAAGTIYLYFKNKEALFSAMVARHVREIGALHHAALDAGTDPVDGLRRCVRSVLTYFNAHRSFFKVFYSASPGGRAHIPSNLDGSSLEEYLGFKRRLVDNFAAAQARGAVRGDLPPEELAEFIDAVVVVTLARWSMSGSAPPPDEQFRILWSLFGGGLGLGAADATP
ncbi:MAG TPA: TetR/AcrR family transcriptional regulator [Planctomycetota bacterium]|nr:TetR/AcrR family transcriptional regulator [Planctomycetota bacterium]